MKPEKPPPSFPPAASYAMAAAFAVCAYLSLVNLDWATLWDDEAISAYLARNWMELGAPLADDGRNLFTDTRGAKPDGTLFYPPLMPWLTSMVFALFGAGDAQARMLSALLTLAAMALFALILRREFPRSPWLAATAFALACLSPLTLGYARSATYNALVLLAHMTVFWAYLNFRAHSQPRSQAVWAAALAAAAIAGFHAHYVANLTFMTALAAAHLLFRRREFDRRAWALSAAAAGVYAAQAGWAFLSGYSGAGDQGVEINLTRFAPELWQSVKLVNHNNLLAWSVALCAIVLAAAARLRAWKNDSSDDNDSDDSMPPPRIRWYEDMPRIDWYLAALAVCVVSLALQRTAADFAGIRYISSFAPFAAVVSAAVLHCVWNRARIAGAALGAVLLLSNAAGWPLLCCLENDSHRPKWTLPALALEYHRDYPDLQRESLDYIRENVPKDSLVFASYKQCGVTVLLWELSDHLRMCCALERPTPGVNTRGREHLLIPRVLKDEITPDYVLWTARPPFTDRLILPGVSGRTRYRRMEDFPGAIYGYCSPHRPEPAWRTSRPDLLKYNARRSHLYQLERP
ncbi:MAG: glycosyltransferase family 39 protein [Gammaproteobacteria bacterium]|nr:glycosyltransferase family 39 protein [Gammaproteobacteria bacterium]